MTTSSAGDTKRPALPLAAGFRQTMPRRLVWATVGRLRSHCTVEDIANDLAARQLELPRSTIYRALDALVRSGVIHVAHFGGGPARYEPASEPHHHAIWRRCHSILHLENRLTRELEVHLELQHHFHPTRVDAVTLGYCAKCTEAGTEVCVTSESRPSASA